MKHSKEKYPYDEYKENNLNQFSDNYYNDINIMIKNEQDMNDLYLTDFIK
jgi:hypothetical protein